MGGIELDFTQAAGRAEGRPRPDAIMGGIDIKVPVTSASSSAGIRSWGNREQAQLRGRPGPEQTLSIKATAILGV